MGDLKIYAKDEKQLRQSLKLVQEFSQDIHMEFGIDKCATASFKRGKLTKIDNEVINERMVFKSIDADESY